MFFFPFRICFLLFFLVSRHCIILNCKPTRCSSTRNMLSSPTHLSDLFWSRKQAYIVHTLSLVILSFSPNWNSDHFVTCHNRFSGIWSFSVVTCSLNYRTACPLFHSDVGSEDERRYLFFQRALIENLDSFVHFTSYTDKPTDPNLPWSESARKSKSICLRVI